MMSNLGDIYVQGIQRFYSLESFRITFCIVLSFECQKDNKDISYYLMFFYRHVKNCHPSIKELKCLFRGCQFVIKVIIQRIITKTVAIIAIIIELIELKIHSITQVLNRSMDLAEISESFT